MTNLLGKQWTDFCHEYVIGQQILLLKKMGGFSIIKKNVLAKKLLERIIKYQDSNNRHF
jgi:hypothetical protein